ncbi:MAG TPA: hypothetical protein VF158_01310 [Longimicrobiales bacterium]
MARPNRSRRHRRSAPTRALRLALGATAAAALALGCDDSPTRAGGDGPPDDSSRVEPDTVTVSEVYLTERDAALDIDSPVAWRRPDGSVWLFATAKEGDVVLVHDAATGRELRRFGGTGTGAGRLDRPNGIAVAGDLLLVVERDNRRVQGFSLPDLEPLGTFGSDTLRRPYGIAVVETAGGLDVYITDQDERDLPAEQLLSTRVKQFRVTRDGDALGATLVRTFGDVSGAGALHAVETIFADPARDRLLIADELSRDINVYTLSGTFTGTEISGLFQGEPEGIALYRCGNEGYWILTDQHDVRNTFHVLARQGLTYLGAFRGAVTRNTDGVAVIEGDVGPLEAGAFFAVHDDGNIGAFAWADVTGALGLTGC